MLFFLSLETYSMLCSFLFVWLHDPHPQLDHPLPYPPLSLVAEGTDPPTHQHSAA